MSELKALPGKVGVRSRMVDLARSTRKKRQGRRNEWREVEIIASDGTPAGDLAAAVSEAEAAAQAWARIRARNEALARPRDVSDSEARALGLESIYREDGRGVRIIDPVEVEMVQARTAREREEAALALADARDKLAAARVVATNVDLDEAVAAYEPLAAETARRVEALERAVAEVVVLTWDTAEAMEREKVAASALVAIAKKAATSDQARHAVKLAAEDGMLVAEMGTGGPVRTIGRPRRLAFGGADPRKAAFWSGLAELAMNGRKRGRAAVGRRIGAALDAAEQRTAGADHNHQPAR